MKASTSRLYPDFEASQQIHAAAGFTSAGSAKGRPSEPLRVNATSTIDKACVAGSNPRPADRPHSFPAKPQRLLAVDDDPRVLADIERVATAAGFKVETTLSGVEFMTIANLFRPTALAIDVFMPDIDGIELVRWLGAQEAKSKIVLLSEYSPLYAKCAAALAEHFGLGPVTVLEKPLTQNALRRALE